MVCPEAFPPCEIIVGRIMGHTCSFLPPTAERTVALLAFSEPSTSPVGDLLGVAQRQKTASELNAAILLAQVRKTDFTAGGLQIQERKKER